MDKEFHYYITYIIARRARFSSNDSYIIAYSSQYTDDNTDDKTGPLYISQGTPYAYERYISQTMNILKPAKELMRIYPIFHFLPGSLDEIIGDSANRSDGKFHLMNTIPDSKNSRMVLSEALKTDNLYRIGIATHTYVDTFAHQNFVGFNDTFNDLSGLLEWFIPSIGHADAKHQPDIPNQLWWDKRLVPSRAWINNKTRFLEAAGHLFDLYRGHCTNDDSKTGLIGDIDEAIGAENVSTTSERTKKYKELIGDEFVEYDKESWFKDAVKFVNADVSHPYSGDTVPRTETVWTWRDDSGYRDTHWFKFQEAVKAHQEYVLANVMRPIYAKMGQTVW